MDTTITGIISFFTSLLVSGQAIRRFGWTVTAILTPLVLLLTSVGFFGVLLGEVSLAGVLTLIGTSPLALIVFFGSAQNCLGRAAKFTLFDATKELAFIPLSKESKLKGKAAIDGVGSRLGKSGGSIIHQGLLMIFSTITASAAYVGVILILIISCWMVAVRSLGRKFVRLTAEEPVPPPAAASPEPAAAVEEEPVLTGAAR